MIQMLMVTRDGGTVYIPISERVRELLGWKVGDDLELDIDPIHGTLVIEKRNAA